MRVWFLRSASMMAAALALASCAHSAKYVRTDYKGEPKAVVLATSIGGDMSAPNITVFVNEMEKALRSCHFEARSVGRAPKYKSGLLTGGAIEYTDADVLKDASSAVDVFNDKGAPAPLPSAFLVVSELSKSQRPTYGNKYEDMGRRYRARFVDMTEKDNTLVWSMEFSMPGDAIPAGPNPADGKVTQMLDAMTNLARMGRETDRRDAKANALVAELMSNLIKDGVFKTCPDRWTDADK